jgi:L-ascorbate metabolism protein UlaG (beta-lactamase superfamily)
MHLSFSIDKLRIFSLGILLYGCTAVEPSNVSSALFDASPDGDIDITYLGTSSFLIEAFDTTILVDGFITRPGVFRNFLGKIDSDSKKVRNLLNRLEVDDVESVFVSHSHHDHVLDSANIANLYEADLYGSDSTLFIADNYPLTNNQRNLLNDRETIYLANRKLKITAIEASHSPPIPFVNDDKARTIDKTLDLPAKRKHFFAGTPFELLLESGDLSVYIISSAAQNSSLLARPKADILFIATPLFGLFSNSYAEEYVAQAIREIDPELIIPIHWDNFTAPISGKLKTNPFFTPNLRLIKKQALSHDTVYCLLQGLQVLSITRNGHAKCG